MQRFVLAQVALCRGFQTGRRRLASRRVRTVAFGHPRNAFTGTYDMEGLASCSEALRAHVIPASRSAGGRDTIDFGDPASVLALNAALLAKDYGVARWSLPEGALCPPIPSRADYVHHVADVLASSRGGGAAPTGPGVRGFDVGTGASLVYPLLGRGAYGWSFVASEADRRSYEHARDLVAANGLGDGDVDVRRQPSPASIFDGVLGRGETVDFSMCNPPFYESRAAFRAATKRKRTLLAKHAERRNPNYVARAPTADLTRSNNFGGTDAELWCPGGEVAFIGRIIAESERVKRDCLWFSSLLSRKSKLPLIERRLKTATDVRIISTGRGQKTATLVFWSFFSPREQRDWAERQGWL